MVLRGAFAQRSSVGIARRISDSDRLVPDNNGSGLEWQRGFSVANDTQAVGIAYCASLPLDGGGWRVSPKDELLSIVEVRFFTTIEST